MRGVPCYGQLLVFDRRAVYGVHVFTDTIRVRRGFTPGGNGYRLFARDHDADKDRWSVTVPVCVRAMVLAGDTLFVAGAARRLGRGRPAGRLRGPKRRPDYGPFPQTTARSWPNTIWISPPVLDGLIAARGNLYLSTRHGRLICFHAGGAPEDERKGK